MNPPRSKNADESPESTPQTQPAIGDLSVTFLPNAEPQETVIPTSPDQHSAQQEQQPTPESFAESRSRFQILRPHAKGGLGEVSVATDTELNRQVALKEIQARFAGDLPNRMRFVLEAEVTGALEHPGIVPVYGLGQYQDGRPYYAMRFVKGDSLKEAVDRFHENGGIKNAPREFRSLLRRLVDVCNAIGYAHSRGVLHRDVKPSNVMLGEYGETLVVDWGLAKILGREDLEFTSSEEPVGVTSGDSSQTLDGSTIGTPAFMPPEQAAGDLKNLGPAADVYSLGATLFYIVTGKAPVEGDGLLELLTNVQQGKLRSAREINPHVSAPLDSIAAKALAHDPTNRYSTPQSLAEEIERWLADEPVLAHRDPATVRLRRWARRHPKSVTATAAALLLGLSSAAAIATVVSGKNAELAEANLELEQAYEAQTLATVAMDEARARAEEQRKIADSKAAEAKAVLEFFEEKVLAAARPKGQEGGLGIDVTVRQAMDHAARTLGDTFAEQPSVEAIIREALGETYGLLGEWPLAEAELFAAVKLLKVSGAEVDHLRAESSLMEYIRLAGRSAETVEPLQAILAKQTELLGEKHEDTLSTASNLGASYLVLGQNQEAIAILKPTIAAFEETSGKDSQQTLATRSYLVNAMLNLGQTKEVRPMLEEMVELSTQTVGPRHPDTLSFLGNLCYLYSTFGDYEKALEINARVLAVRTELLGPTHPSTLTSRSNQANLIRMAGRLEEAVGQMLEVAELADETLGPNHPDTMKYQTNIAGAYMYLNRPEWSVQIFEALLPRQEKQLGQLHPDYVRNQLSSGMAFAAAGQIEEAKQMYRAAIDSYSQLHGEDSNEVKTLQSMLEDLETPKVAPKEGGAKDGGPKETKEN